MKILSIAVPCYNSEAYMEKCIDSLLVGGEEVEILIVDDGSKDGTTEIADRYQEKYPTNRKSSCEAERWTRRCSELWTGSCDRKVF